MAMSWEQNETSYETALDAAIVRSTDAVIPSTLTIEAFDLLTLRIDWGVDGSSPPTLAETVIESTSAPGAIAVEPAPKSQREFYRLSEEWRQATGQLSNPQAIILHRAYQRIIGLGPTVLPLIFGELLERGGLWFWALEAITGDNPVPPGSETMREVREAWLAYAALKGYTQSHAGDQTGSSQSPKLGMPQDEQFGSGL
jgi:hypothetical protein